MAVGTSRKLTKYRITILALFVVMAMVGGAIIASPAAAESDSEHLLSGTVVDESDDPIEDADVFIQDDDTDELVAEVLTDADGEYEIELEEGDYVMAAEADGFLSPSPVMVTLDEDRTQNLELETAATIEGTVKDEDDTEIDDVRVSAEQDGSSYSTSTEEGMYSIDVPEGDYTVTVSDYRFEGGSVDVFLEKGETKEEDLEATKLSTGTLEGEVTDEEGESLEEAYVEIVQDGEHLDFVTTDADGQYDIELVHGEYTVFAVKDGFQTEERIVNIDEDTTTIEEFELEELVTLDGQVTDTDDNALTEADISLVEDGETVEESQTDSNGEYEVEVPTGEYTVEISDSVHEDISEGVTLTESETRNFELEPLSTGTLEGEVTDEEGESLEEAIVDIQQNGDSVDFVRTDADGQYDIELADGEYNVIAFKDGFQFEQRTVDIEEDTTTIENFELEELVILDGAVTDTDGNGLGGVDVSVVQDGEPVEATETSSDGEYEVEVTTGEYTVEVSDTAHEDISEEVSLTESETKDFELEPLSAGTLEGAITDQEDEPLEDAWVDIQQNGDSVGFVQTDADGQYNVELEEGEYTAIAFKDGFWEELRTVNIEEDATTEKDFTLAELFTLEGEVTDTDDNALEGIDISFVEDGELVKDTETASTGEYEVQLPAGEYTVELSDSVHEDISEDVTLTESETKNFELEPASTGTLEGEVTDEDGEPLEDATVDILQNGDSVDFVRTDTDGQYELEVEDGEYTIFAAKDGFEVEERTVNIDEDATTTETFELGELVTLDGEVTDEEGDPIEDTWVHLRQDGDFIESVPADEDGEYEIELSPGEYTVEPDADGFLSGSTTVDLDEDTTENLELEIAAVVEGTVTDEDDNAVEDIFVDIKQNGALLSSVPTGEDGSYSHDVAEGDYTVSVNAQTYEGDSAEVSLTSGETTTQDLEATPASTGTLEGEVTDEDENTIEEADVTIYQDGVFTASTETAGDGTYDLELGEGEYSAFVDAGDSAATTTSISIEADETVAEDFVVEEMGTIEGTVLDEDDTEISDSTVDIKQNGELLVSSLTSDDGSYEGPLPPGEYTLTGDADGYEEASYDVTVTEETSTTQDIELASEEDDETDAGGGGAPSLGPAEFEVSIREAPDSVAAGETVSVEVAVENVGGTTGEQTITLEHDGDQIADDTLELTRDQQRFITLTGEVDEGADGEQTFILSSDDDAVETSLSVEAETEEETDESDETEEADEDDADEADTEETEDDSEEASDDSAEAEETDDEPAEDEIVEDDDQPGFGVTVAVIALLGLLVGTRLSRNE